MKWSTLSLIGAVLLLEACEVTQHLPVNYESLNIRMSADELICHVRKIAKAHRLDFHYSTSEQDFGTMVAFRLIGDDFELILANDARPYTYELSAYDLSDDAAAQNPAKEAFAVFRRALVERPNVECRG